MKKTIFGVILAAFLVMSVSWITPINVKAAESASKQMNEKLVQLAEDLLDDNDLKALVENEGLKEILDQIRDANTQDEKEYFAEQYVAFIQNDEGLRTAFDSLKSEYSDDIDTLTKLAERIINNNDFESNGKFYELDIENNELKVEKVDSDNVEGDAIILTPDLTVKTTDIDFGLIGLILIFVVLPGMLLIAGLIYTIVAVIQEILVWIKTLFDGLELILAVIGVIGAVVGFLLMVFEEAIEQLTSTLFEAIQQLSRSKVLTFRERVQQFFARIFVLFQNLKLVKC